MVKTYLDGVAIGFYRGIGEVQRIGPFSDVNFFIGPNNAGKSIVLNFIHERLPFGTNNNRFKFDQNGTKAYRGAERGEFVSGAGVSVSNVFDRFNKKHEQRLQPDDDDVRELIHGCIGHLASKGCLWQRERRTDTTAPLFLYEADDTLIQKFQTNVWLSLGYQMFGIRYREIARQLFPLLREEFYRHAQVDYPSVELVPAKRILGKEKNEDFKDSSGAGLIPELARLQDPDWNEEHKRELFDKINRFLQEVTGKKNAEIRVPHERNHLLVRIDEKLLPLDNFGTGIHEVILIAAFCTIHNEQIICIEEPEIHLHPTLQRKLIRYLQENTDNQYFIATHSAAFIDTPGASVFRVHNDGVQSYVEPALLKDDKWQICADLGYRASDILQANMVIWVEGPSDRIYLNHWIAAIDPDLIEGTHYTIMFYGGGLVSHLSAESEGDPLGELIDLRSLNKNMAIVMDSDKASARAHLKGAPKRLKAEVADQWGMVWITKGREIENYVDYDDLQDVLRKLHPQVYGGSWERGEFDHAFYFKRKGKAEPYKDANKVGAARKICEQNAKLDVLDLRERVTELVALIHRANDSGDAQKQP